MEALINWMESLNPSEAIRYAILLAGIMIFIPLSDTISKLIKKLVSMKKMKIVQFGYSFSVKDLEIPDTSEDVVVNRNSADFVIEGGKALLFWKVEGALSVRVYPKIGKVSGNLAEVLVTRQNRSFTLEARGLFSRERMTLSIPESKIKTLETGEISKKKVQTEVTKVKSLPFTKRQISNRTMKAKQLFNRRVFLGSKSRGWSMNYQLPKRLIQLKINLSEFIQKSKILKTYSFSTKKYNSLIQVKPFNSKNHE